MTGPDIVVIGAGPAGMAAASLASTHGASVLLLDEQGSAGGQIYRGVGRAEPNKLKLLGDDYASGRLLVEALARSGVRHRTGAVVWRLDPDGLVVWSEAGTAQSASARHVIIATGALERPVPVPGWTLPGVMTAGAAQIMLKASGLLPETAVLAGSGPLLYLLAVQMIEAGCPPLALVETQRFSDQIGALRHLPASLGNYRQLAKGLHLLAHIKRAGIPRHAGAEDLAIEGTDAATGLRFRTSGRDQHIPCETILLHQGVVPNTQITNSLRLDHVWDDSQRCFRPVVDPWGVTSDERFSVAGDGAGIAGAIAAEAAGRLAALGALERLDLIDAGERDRLAEQERHVLNRERASRPFLDRLYPPPRAHLGPPDDVIVCRCESVTAGQIRGYAKAGCLGPNQAKAFGRCGMGPCQGRYCGLTVTEILAEETGRDPADVGAYRIRAPLKPVTLGELASLAEDTGSPD